MSRMYYVLFVGSGHESEVESCIDRYVPAEACERHFVPRRCLRRKLRGQWVDYQERLIPGYVFVQSGDIELLSRSLRDVPAYTRILGAEASEGETRFYPLNEDEAAWLRKLMGAGGEEEMLDAVPLSQVGFDEKDRAVILSGPLRGMEGSVIKLNLHRRIAEVEVELMGRKTILHLGIDLLKSADKES